MVTGEWSDGGTQRESGSEWRGTKESPSRLFYHLFLCLSSFVHPSNPSTSPPAWHWWGVRVMECVLDCLMAHLFMHVPADKRVVSGGGRCKRGGGVNSSGGGGDDGGPSAGSGPRNGRLLESGPPAFEVSAQ